MDLTVESMMLDSKASDLDREERPEVFCSVSDATLLIAFLFYSLLANPPT